MGTHLIKPEKDGVFEIDLELFLPLNQSGKSDNLDNTINYQDIMRITTEAFTCKQYSLVEAAAESVCNSLLNEFEIDNIIIRVRKPHAPIQAEFDSVEIELNRKK